MPARLRKVPKVNVTDTAEVRAIHERYFLTLGLACESGLPYHSPEWHAAWKIKFGAAQYRREAWLTVRGQVRLQVPPEGFETMDRYFSCDAPKHFTHAFDFQTLEKMLSAVRNHEQKPALLKTLPEGIGQSIDPLE